MPPDQKGRDRPQAGPDKYQATAKKGAVEGARQHRGPHPGQQQGDPEGVEGDENRCPHWRLQRGQQLVQPAASKIGQQGQKLDGRIRNVVSRTSKWMQIRLSWRSTSQDQAQSPESTKQKCLTQLLTITQPLAELKAYPDKG